MLERRSIRCATSSGLLRVLAHGEQVLHCDLCYVEDVSACLRYGLCPLYYVSLVALLVPCLMFGFMEMFGPQGSVRIMCAISLFCPGHFVSRFVVTSLVSRFASLRRIYS